MYVCMTWQLTDQLLICDCSFYVTEQLSLSGMKVCYLFPDLHY